MYACWSETIVGNLFLYSSLLIYLNKVSKFSPLIIQHAHLPMGNVLFLTKLLILLYNNMYNLQYCKSNYITFVFSLTVLNINFLRPKSGDIDVYSVVHFTIFSGGSSDENYHRNLIRQYKTRWFIIDTAKFLFSIPSACRK